MKKILMITTGGTVCSTDEGGLTPTMGPDAALKYIPSVYKLCDVDFLPLYSIDSTNIASENSESCSPSLSSAGCGASGALSG